jgi:hypothetical protein
LWPVGQPTQQRLGKISGANCVAWRAARCDNTKGQTTKPKGGGGGYGEDCTGDVPTTLVAPRAIVLVRDGVRAGSRFSLVPGPRLAYEAKRGEVRTKLCVVRATPKAQVHRKSETGGGVRPENGRPAPPDEPEGIAFV